MDARFFFHPDFYVKILEKRDGKSRCTVVKYNERKIISLHLYISVQKLCKLCNSVLIYLHFPPEKFYVKASAVSDICKRREYEYDQSGESTGKKRRGNQQRGDLFFRQTSLLFVLYIWRLVQAITIDNRPIGTNTPRGSSNSPLLPWIRIYI